MFTISTFDLAHLFYYKLRCAQLDQSFSLTKPELFFLCNPVNSANDLDPKDNFSIIKVSTFKGLLILIPV